MNNTQIINHWINILVLLYGIFISYLYKNCSQPHSLRRLLSITKLKAVWNILTISFTNCIIGSYFDPFMKNSFLAFVLRVLHTIITIEVATEYVMHLNKLLISTNNVHMKWKVYRNCDKESKKILKNLEQTKSCIAMYLFYYNCKLK